MTCWHPLGLQSLTLRQDRGFEPGFGGRVLGASPDPGAHCSITIRATYFLSLSSRAPTCRVEQSCCESERGHMCRGVAQLRTADIWASCSYGGSCPVHCGMSSSFLVLNPPDARSDSSCSGDNKNYLQRPLLYIQEGCDIYCPLNSFLRSLRKPAGQ